MITDFILTIAHLLYNVDSTSQRKSLHRKRKDLTMTKSRDYIGEFEEMVLLAIFSLKDNAYGVPIREALEEATGRTVSVGALYATLNRLEEKGLISSNPGEATPERGGRAKRYFTVEGRGLAALSEVEAARRRLVPKLKFA